MEHFFDYPPYRIPYLVRVSSRTKRLKLAMEPDQGLVLTTPEGVNEREWEQFLSQNVNWMFFHWRRFERLKSLHSDRFLPLEKRPLIWYLGKEYRLVYEENHGRAGAHFDGEKLILRCFDDAEGKRLLGRWYRTQARAVISASLINYAQRMKVQYGDVVMRDQKTRWGSCSVVGNLNFNWRLIMAPREVLDYVVVHELAHRKEMNHSDRFWRIVEEQCKDYKKHQVWLKKNAVLLTI